MSHVRLDGGPDAGSAGGLGTGIADRLPERPFEHHIRQAAEEAEKARARDRGEEQRHRQAGTRAS